MEWSESQLMWAVQALAQPADVQPNLFPSFVVVADELALEFDQWSSTAESQIGQSWSREQKSAISAIDQLLNEMSGLKPELWTEPGCLNHALWSEVRMLAKVALATFDWPDDLPPFDRFVYVPAGK